MKYIAILLLNVLLIYGVGVVNGRKGFRGSEQEWGYVTVRPGAHMFWWLYYTTSTSPPSNVSAINKPLIIWIQGGLGKSASGVGNFEEFGPVSIDGSPRKHSWIHDYNVLFIDNPVGAGFSYVEDETLFADSNTQFAKDLLECIKGFLSEVPEFQSVSTYVLSQPYEGKMAAELAFNWYTAQKDGSIKSKLKGIGFGNSWISPMDSLESWAPFLFHMGAVDVEGRKAVEEKVKEIQEAVAQENWENASQLWLKARLFVYNLTAGIDFSNVLHKVSVEKPLTDSRLKNFMNSQVKTALNVNATWGQQSDRVFMAVSDFMKNATHIVKKLKDETDLEIFVYNGQLDLIVPTAGTLKWVERIFDDTDDWRSATRSPIVVDNIIEGYKKEHKNFKMYWILRAGHYTATENPAIVHKMLQHLTQTTPIIAA